MTAADENSFWRSVPRIMESIAESESEIPEGRTFGPDDLRADGGWQAAATNASAATNMDEAAASTLSAWSRSWS